jgi:hypothetical protein
MRSGLICHATEAPCTDVRCTTSHCLIEIRDRIDKQDAEGLRADLEWLRKWFTEDEIRRVYLPRHARP